MRLLEVEQKQNGVDPGGKALFPNSEADHYQTDYNGLYLNDPDMTKKHGPYYGAVYDKNREGMWRSQVSVTQGAGLSAVNALSFKDKIPPNYKEENANNRGKIILGYFEDPRDAAYAAQHVRFGENYEHLVQQWLEDIYLTKTHRSNDVWKPALVGKPSWEFPALTASERVAAPEKYTGKQLQTYRENRRKFIENLVPKFAEKLHKELGKTGTPKMPTTELARHARNILGKLTDVELRDKHFLETPRFAELMQQEIGTNLKSAQEQG